MIKLKNNKYLDQIQITFNILLGTNDVHSANCHERLIFKNIS